MRRRLTLGLVLAGLVSVTTYAALAAASRFSSTGEPQGGLFVRTAPLGESRRADEVLARIDGVVVTKGTFDNYAGAFVDPNGNLTVDRNQILDAVINQAIASREASRRNIVISDQSVDAMVEQWSSLNLPPSSLERSGGMSALRERFRNFLIFRAVKRAVTSVSISDQAIRTAQAADPILAGLPFADVAGSLRTRLEREETDRQWTLWLSAQRACTDVVVLDPSFAAVPSTPRPDCNLQP